MLFKRPYGTPLVSRVIAGVEALSTATPAYSQASLRDEERIVMRLYRPGQVAGRR
ncbi:MAG: hypothetical protein JW892_13560 [Anaerolineae bacterium]|nr:hypothetical protein [Anaerolineae bacterium]